MPHIRKRKCPNCSSFFIPDPRNAHSQKFCSRPQCRKASKAASQRRWLRENRGYFSGPDNVRRVQLWRKDNPGYWRRKTPRQKDALQDPLTVQVPEKQDISSALPANALQDPLSLQDPVLIGLISQLTGIALQDDIVIAARKLHQLGSDILNSTQGGRHDPETSYLSAAYPPSAQTVQLGGSALGP